MSEFPIAPVVGYGRGETQVVRDFIARTDGIPTVRVPLSRGKACCLVDREDWIRLEIWRWNWGIVGGRYAYRKERRNTVQKLYRMIYLHRLILGIDRLGRDVEGDHRNGYTLDNRRKNLRSTNIDGNRQNARLRRDSSSGYRGVNRTNNVPARPWRAQIQAGGQTVFLGYFATIKQAVAARNAAAARLHGEFARAA